MCESIGIGLAGLWYGLKLLGLLNGQTREHVCLGDGKDCAGCAESPSSLGYTFLQPLSLSEGCWSCVSTFWDQEAGIPKKGLRFIGSALYQKPGWLPLSASRFHLRI